MIECPRCGFRHFEDAPHCMRCGAVTDHDLAPGELPKQPRFALPAWRFIGRLRSLSERMVVAFSEPPHREVPHRDPWTAGLLSLLPGLGQCYNTQWRLGFLHLATFAGLLAAGISFILHRWSDLFFLAALLWMNFSVNQAFVTAQRINGATLLGVRSWRSFFAFLFLLAGLMALAQWVSLSWMLGLLTLALAALAFANEEGRLALGRGRAWRMFAVPFGFLLVLMLGMWQLPSVFFRSSISLRLITQDVYAPLVPAGARVIFENVAFGLRGPKVGDIVLYDPPGFKMERGENMWLVNMTLNMERVVGGPGDVVERRRGEWFRNGQPTPPGEQPLVQDQLWRDLKLVVPAGHFAVLTSYTPQEFFGMLGGPPLHSAIVIGWENASLITRDKMYGRAVLVYTPPRHRKGLLRD